MTVNDINELKQYVESALSSGLRLQQINITKNIGITVFITDLEKSKVVTAYLGIPNQEEMHRKCVLQVFKEDDNTPNIILPGE